LEGVENVAANLLAKLNRSLWFEVGKSVSREVNESGGLGVENVATNLLAKLNSDSGLSSAI